MWFDVNLIEIKTDVQKSVISKSDILQKEKPYNL